MAFSATDAAFEGFRIARERPKAVLIWAVASLLINLASTAGMIAMFGGTLSQFMTMSQTGSDDPAAAMALMGQLGVMYLILLPVVVIILSIFTAAVYRAVLKPEDSALGYLRLGMAELRIGVVFVVLFLLSLVVTVVAILVVALVAGVIGGLLSVGASGNVGTMIFVGVMVVLLYIGMLFVSLAFWTKLSLAGPMTFAEGRIRIFGSWNATKGRFWPLFGCYLLALVLGVVVQLLGGAISLAAMLALGGSAMGADTFMGLIESLEADYTSLASFFTPAVIVNLTVSSLFTALTYAIFLAPPAVAYREIVARNSPAVAETFG